MQQIWQNRGGLLYREYPAIEQEKLDNIVYVLGFNPSYGQFYLKPRYQEFTFDYKLYDLQERFIERFCRTYDVTKGNLGALLNGTKGTGKTVTSKLICNKLNMPVIVVDSKFGDTRPEKFLNNIPQDIVIFVDEYEKIYSDSNNMLTIMDGALNAEHRRVFLFTTNKLHIEDNLKQRPSRLRYLKSFSDLKPEIVSEIVNDCLIYPERKKEVMNFIMTLELITVDIVRQVVQEVNIHNEDPKEFAEDFNVRKREGKYDIYEVKEDGTRELQSSNVNIYPRPDFQEGHEGNWFEFKGNTVGRIAEVLDYRTILVNLYVDDDYDEVREQICIQCERSYRVHSSYAYGGYGDYDEEFVPGMGGRTTPRYGIGENANRSKVNQGFMERIKTPSAPEDEDSEDSGSSEHKVAASNPLDELANKVAERIAVMPAIGVKDMPESEGNFIAPASEESYEVSEDSEPASESRGESQG